MRLDMDIKITTPDGSQGSKAVIGMTEIDVMTRQFKIPVHILNTAGDKLWTYQFELPIPSPDAQLELIKPMLVAEGGELLTD